jgi:hypothetical protein
MKSFIALILLGLALLPSAIGGPIPSTSSDYFGQGFILTGLVFVSFLASKNNISGPLRYGISQYGPWISTLYQKSPDWAILGLLSVRVLLPWTHMWLIGIVALGWQYTLQHFNEAVREVTDQANNICARANIAANNTREDAIDAVRYERDALTNTAVALRDVRRAHGIKVSDFYEEAMTIWSAIGSALNSVRTAADYSTTAVNAAESAYNSARSYSSSSSSTTNANNYFTYTKSASVSLNNAIARALSAQQAVVNFEKARSLDEQARQRERSYSSTVTSKLKKLADRTNTLPAGSAKLVKMAEDLRYQVTRALTAADQGRMDQAKQLITSATKELDIVEKEADRIASEKREIRRQFISQVLDE